MPTSSIDGLVSGLDTTSIVNSLIALERAPADRLASRKSNADAKAAAYSSLRSKVDAVKTAFRRFVNLVPRWYDGYQLAFHLGEPPLVTVTTDSLILRLGPGDHYRHVDTAARGKTLVGAGRNLAANWIQVLLADGTTAWLPTTAASISQNVQNLPLSRSTFED